MKHILILLIIVIAASCKKKNEPTQTDYLTKGSWKVTKLDYKIGSASTWTDGFAALQNCKKDDLATFQVNGAYLLTEGSTKCNLSDPETIVNSTWAFSSDRKRIVFPSPLPEWVIESLNDVQFIYSYSKDVGPVTYYYIVTMQH